MRAPSQLMTTTRDDESSVLSWAGDKISTGFDMAAAERVGQGSVFDAGPSRSTARERARVLVGAGCTSAAAFVTNNIHAQI
jgi:hypothetical protein